MTASSPTPSPAFLDGGGIAAERIRQRDWSDHPLGPPQGWPEALRVALALVLNSPESMILCWGAEDLFFFFNDAYQPLLGPRLSWAMGARFDEVWADAVDQARPIIAEAFAGRSTRYEDLPWTLRRYGQDERTWFSFSYSRVLDGDGRIAGLFILTNETTKRYLGEQALREAGELLDQAQRAGGVGLFSVDADGQMRGTPAFHRVYGLGERTGDYPASIVEALVLPEDRHIGSTLATRASGEAATDVEYRIRRADTGEVRWIARKGRFERDEAGRVVRFAGSAQDVTEQVETRDALAAANRQLAALVADRTRERDRLWTMSRDPFLIADAGGTWLSVSPAWTDILGWREDELVGRTDAWIVHPDDAAANRALVEELAATGEPVHRYENRYRTRDGEWRWFSWTAAPADGLLFCVARDVTDEKARAAELVRTEEQLRQSQKVEAVGQLTGGVAHDFNNLLTVIRGSIDLLRRPNLSEERRQRYLAAISDTADRATRLTGQLLAFARRQALRPETFDVGASVLALREMAQTLTGPGVELVFAVPDVPVFVDADRSQFDTAIVNMAANARDAMAGEGQLTITVATAPSMPAMRTHREVAGDHVTVTLHDTGSGIEAERIDHIFEPFYTTKGIGQGTGLGLSQVFGFAKQSGGDVTVTSTPGHGASFTLYLPLVVPGREAGAADEGLEPPTLKRGASILVVEDNPQVGGFAAQALRELGHRVHLAPDAAAALAVLQRDPAGFDILFSDVMMPGMSGIELGREARRLYPALPVLLTSGYSAVLAAEGADGFPLLRKPYSLEALAAALGQAVAVTGQRLHVAQS